MSISLPLGRVNKQGVYLLLHPRLLLCSGEGDRQLIVDVGIVPGGCVLEAAVNKHLVVAIYICSLAGLDGGNKG